MDENTRRQITIQTLSSEFIALRSSVLDGNNDPQVRALLFAYCRVLQDLTGEYDLNQKCIS